MTATTAPQLSLTRVFNARRALVYQSFTDPDQFAAWWGPIGNQLPRDEIEFDIRRGGYQQWTEVVPDDPGIRVRIRVDLADVIEGALLDGTMRVGGQLPGGYQPFETRMRLEFHDEADGRTRLEIRQWLPEHLVSPTENGWKEAFAKLDAALVA